MLVAAVLALLSGDPSASPVAYRLTPLMQEGEVRQLAVDISLRGDADGETRLDFHIQGPDHATDLGHLVEDLHVVGGPRGLDDDVGGIVIEHAPGAALNVSYTVRSAFAAPLGVADDGNPYDPMIMGDWFSVLGSAVFAHPADFQRPALFEWGQLPDGWRVVSDLDHGGLTVGGVRKSVMVGAPDLTVTSFGDPSAPVRLAMIGEWELDEDALADALERVMSSNVDFWGAEASPFVVAMTPLVPSPRFESMTGTGLGDAFSLYAGTDIALETLPWLLTHEHLHSWMPLAMGGLDVKPESASYWFSEGFTDFMTLRLTLRSGLWSLDDFIAAWNERLATYWTSPERESPNTAIAQGFWSDPGLGDLPYKRGMVLAALWHKQLRDAGYPGGLDDVLRDMTRMEATTGDALARIDRAMATRGIDIKPDLARYIQNGAMVVLPSDAFAPCAQVSLVRRAPFQRGFNIEATMTANNVIQGVLVNGPAYAAGMRDGMLLIRREAPRVNSSEVAISYRVRDGETERVITYLPQGDGEEVIQRLDLSPDLSVRARADCLKSLGGD